MRLHGLNWLAIAVVCLSTPSVVGYVQNSDAPNRQQAPGQTSSDLEIAVVDPAVSARNAAYEAAADDDQATLNKLLDQADKTFQPIAPEQLEARRQHLAQAVNALDKYLSGRGVDRQGWHDYLAWNQLTNQARNGAAANPAVLRTLWHRFTAGHEGLELEPFADVADSLQSYLYLVDASHDAQAKANYQADLNAIRQGLSARNTAALRQLSEAAGELARDGHATQLVDALRKSFSHPNLLVNVSANFVSTGVARKVDEVAPLNDTIMGTRVTGTGHTLGNVTARLIPDSDRAVIETVLLGTNYSKTVGRNGPALIHSRGETRLFGRKQVVVDENGLQALPATAEVDTKSNVTGVATTARCGLIDRTVKKIAWKKIPQQKPQADRIATRHAKHKFLDRFNGESAPMVADANERFQNRFRAPLKRLGAYPKLLRFSTTAEQLMIVGLQAPEERFAAASVAPPIDESADLLVRMHESLVNNTAAAMLAGRTLDQPQMDRIAIDLLGELPDRSDEETRTPWSITFAAKDPITFLVDDNSAVVTVRGARYTSDNKPFEAMNVTARYKIALANGQLEATRQGDLEIFPPDFTPGSKLSTRQVVLRRMLQKRFGKIFQESLVSKGLELKGNWESLGVLPVSALKADDGWLAIGWRQPAPAANVALAEAETD